MPKDPNKGFVSNLADEPAFVVADRKSGAVKKMQTAALREAFAPLSHVGAGGAAHALATSVAPGFMSAADKATVSTITSGTWASIILPISNVSYVNGESGYWQRVGNFTELTAYGFVKPIATGGCQVTIPWPSGMTAVTDLARCVGGVIGTGADSYVRADAASGGIEFRWGESSATENRKWFWARVWVGP